MPNLQDLGKLLIGETTEEILVCDLREAIAVCEEKRDFVSREILVKFKDGNEEYEDWLESQQELIESMGVQNYIQLKASDD